MWSTSAMLIDAQNRRGISLMSFSFSAGISTVLMPPRCAASTFSLSPPIGQDAAAQGDLTGHRQVVAHRESS